MSTWDNIPFSPVRGRPAEALADIVLANFPSVEAGEIGVFEAGYDFGDGGCLAAARHAG
jgi:hypothetical protein